MIEVRHTVMFLHEVQRNVDFTYFEAARPAEMPDSERPDGYYFPKRDWVEMDMPETITVTVKTGMVEPELDEWLNMDPAIKKQVLDLVKDQPVDIIKLTVPIDGEAL